MRTGIGDQANRDRRVATSRRQGLWLFSTLGVIAIAASGCGPTSAQPAQPPPPTVTVATPIAKTVTEYDEFTGRLEAVESVEVRSRVSGYISGIHFVQGGLVRKGDLLVQIDPRPFQAEVDRLRAELVRARAAVQRADSELQRGERLASENAMAREERERRAATAKESTADVGSTEAALRAAELNLEFTHITSPIDGRVGRAIVTEGNLVSSGSSDATLLTTVVSLDPIYASFDVDEQSFVHYLALSREGKRAKASGAPASFPVGLALTTDDDFSREGKMFFLDNRIDPTTGTIRVRALFRNADRSLTPGLFARVRLPGSNAGQGILIQDRAVGTDLGKRFVLVVTPDNVVQYREVVIGPLIDSLRLVRTGLTVNDRVVINGLQRVRPGAHVQVETVSMNTPAPAAEQPNGGGK